MRELSRMLAGLEDSELGRAHAEELLGGGPHGPLDRALFPPRPSPNRAPPGPAA